MANTLVIAALWMIGLAGCGASATTVRHDAHGGRIALEGPYMSAMREARALMVEHCGGRFDAMELGRSVDFRCREAVIAAR